MELFDLAVRIIGAIVLGAAIADRLHACIDWYKRRAFARLAKRRSELHAKIIAQQELMAEHRWPIVHKDPPA